jgi:hypothetical protein
MRNSSEMAIRSRWLIVNPRYLRVFMALELLAPRAA